MITSHLSGTFFSQLTYDDDNDGNCGGNGDGHDSDANLL